MNPSARAVATGTLELHVVNQPTVACRMQVIAQWECVVIVQSSRNDQSFAIGLRHAYYLLGSAALDDTLTTIPSATRREITLAMWQLQLNLCLLELRAIQKILGHELFDGCHAV
jgi:hypothetical protein